MLSPHTLIPLLLAALPLSASHVLTPRTPPSTFILDVHSHIVPPIYRSALIAASYPLINGTLFTDGFPVPEWTLESHIASMNSQGISYSTLSVSAPGLNFLANDSFRAKELARDINNLMWEYTKEYPERLGALCLLPLPDVEAAMEEITYCLETLHFDGIAMYTNAAGLYLGDAKLTPLFALLNRLSATIFVHPASPACSSASLGHPDPMTEYPFESVRAMENLLLTGQRANFSSLNIIFPHGGGAMPYLATRIAGMASLPFLGGRDVRETLGEFRGYFFDTASSSSVVQLGALRGFFGGVERILMGSDYPYVPEAQASAAMASTQANGQFTNEEMAKVNGLNALGIFPNVAQKLGFAI